MSLKNWALEGKYRTLWVRGVKNELNNQTSFMDGPPLKKHQSTFEF